MSAISRRLIPAVLLGCFMLQAPLHAVPVRFLAWDDEVAARKIGYQNSKGITPVKDLHPNKRTESIDGGGGEAPVQLVALDRTGTDGKPAAVEIKMPAGIQSPLVLILPDAKNPTGLRPFVIDDSAANFTWGKIRFINATGKALLVKHEKTITALPETWTPVDISPGGAARNLGMQVAAKDDLKSVLYSAIWEHDPDVRKLVFVLPGTDVRTGAVEFKIIPENKRVVAAEAAAESAATAEPAAP